MAIMDNIGIPDRARLLLSMSADELNLARHYEALQYSILAGSVGTSALTVNFGRNLHAAPEIELTARIAIGLLLLSLMALTFRCSALSILSFHSGMQYRNEAMALVSQSLSQEQRSPFDRNFRSAEYIGLSPFVYPTIIVASRPVFLYLAILLTFAFGLVALVLTAPPGLVAKGMA